jgi:cobaltochelatase CobS
MSNLNNNQNKVTLTAAELSALSVKELRKLANEQGLGSGGWRATATKDALVEALSTGLVPATNNGPAASAAELAEVLQRLVQQTTPSIDEDRVREIVAEILPTINLPKTIEIVHPDRTVVNVGRQHPLFDDILDAVELREPLMLVGPVGAGKTHTAEAIATALKIPFWPQSVTCQTTKSDLLGYFDANGNYVPSLFRLAFEFGGIYLLDEVDKGNANVLAVLNSAASNGYVAFPDKVVKAHADFSFLASGNTWGLGRNATFVGSLQLDGSTIDRFTQLEFAYDEALETELCAPYGQPEWVQFVQKVRSVVDSLSIRHCVSPRASIKGSKFLQKGWTWEKVEARCLWKGLDKASVDKVKAALAA